MNGKPAAPPIDTANLPKLGRLPVDEQRIKNVLLLKDVLTGQVPTHPITANHLKGITFGMYGNDNFGVCGPTAIANSRRLVTHTLGGRQVDPSQEDVFDLYRRSGNPNFDPKTGNDDNGVILQKMLEAVVSGGIGGQKAVAFAKFDPGNEQELEAAISIFGFTIDGVTLDVAQQAQTNTGEWKYVRGSGEWGGHCVLGGAYADHKGTSRDTTSAITWAEIVKLSNGFRTHQQDEAWILIWPEHLGSKAFQAGIDVVKLRLAFKNITGQTMAG